MKILCAISLLALLGASGAACGEEAVGRVRAVYFEAARHVYVDTRAQRAPASARLWADVELGSVFEPEKKRALVQIPQELKASPGDVVAVDLQPEQLSRLTANQVPMLRVSRVTEVRARAFAGLGAD
jgi:hypothetical protein